MWTACAFEGGEDVDDFTTITDEILGGSPDADTPAANATVSLGGCTGTLVAPDLVLTAAHCIRRDNNEGCTATEVATSWYPLSASEYPSGYIEVKVGRDAIGVNVNRTWASAWEEFTIGLPGGGSGLIEHGSQVQLRTYDGVHYLAAEWGGGHWITADRTAAQAWETFTIERVLGPGTVASSNHVRLRAHGGQYLVQATDTVGPVLHATGTSTSAAGVFEIRLAYNATGDISAGARVHLRSTTNSRFVVAEEGGRTWKHVGRARHYSIPNGVDIALIKLDAPVPSWIATPVQVLTRSFTDPHTFWPAQTVRIAGWGGTNLGHLDAGRYRQTAIAPNLHFGCQWQGRSHLCIDSSTTNIASGDSGGPLFWTEANLTRQVAVINGTAIPSEPLATYSQDTFSVGGWATCNGTRTLPNVAIWLETMLNMRPQCVAIDTTHATVEPYTGGYRIRSGVSEVIEGPFRTSTDATRALAIMRHYGMDERCMVGNTVEYNLAATRAPTGAPRPDEDCLDIWGPLLTIVNNGGTWTLRQGSSALLDLGTSETVARLALGTIQRYDFRALCFVARPDPAWTYFRR